MASVWCPACQRPHAEPPPADPFTPAELELVRGVLAATLSGSTAQVDAVLDALTTAGWRRESDVRAEVSTELRGLAEYHDPADRLALHSAAEHITARAHRTTPEPDHA